MKTLPEKLVRWTLILGVVFLYGCARDGRPPDMGDRVVVTYWEKWTGFEADAMQEVIDDFNRSQDRIWVDFLSVSQVEQKLLLATAGGNPPDVAGVWSHTITIFAGKGALLPLDRRLEEAGITGEDYHRVYWDLCSFRGFTWALPSTPSALGLHWNKRMFRKAGLDPDRPPRTLEELDRMAEQLTVVEVKRPGGRVQVPYLELTAKEKQAREFDLVQLGHTPTWPGWWTPLYAYWFGGDLWDGDRVVTADAPQNKAAFEWYASYSEKYGVDNLRRFSSSFGNSQSPQDPFLAEQVAMVLQGVWLFNFIDKYAPHLEWAAAPFPPSVEAGVPEVTLAECDVLVIPKGAQHPEEAFEFIRYVNQQGPMEKLCLGLRKFSPLRETDPEFNASHPNPYIQVFVDLAGSPHARTVPRMSIWNEYSTELSVAAERIFSHSASVEEALGDVTRRTQEKMDRTLRRWDRIGEEREEQWRSYDGR